MKTPKIHIEFCTGLADPWQPLSAKDWKDNLRFWGTEASRRARRRVAGGGIYTSTIGRMYRAAPQVVA